MREKKNQYILDDLLRIILAMFVLTALFAFSCLLLSHGARGIWLKKTNRSCSSMPQVIPSQIYANWNVISVKERRWH